MLDWVVFMILYIEYIILQEQLKRFDYAVTTHVNCGHNPYYDGVDGDDLWHRLFQLDLIDNIILYYDKDREWHHQYLPKEHSHLALNFNNIIYLYVDHRNSNLNFDTLELCDGWEIRDDLPKICLAGPEVLDFCQTKISHYPPELSEIHYRPHENNDLNNEWTIHSATINDLLLENATKTFFLCTMYEDIKDKLVNKYDNLIVNNFDFITPTHFSVRSDIAPGPTLMRYMKEIFFEMYLLTHCSSIKRIGVVWFSNFLFLSNTFNQTAYKNKDRYI